jgi:transposase
VLALVSALEPIVQRIAELTAEIRSALADHADGATFRSLFQDPKTAVCPATMVAEIGDCRERYPTNAALAADGGQAPVAVESGKSKRARFRWACDHRLKDAIATMADASRHHNPWAAEPRRARSASSNQRGPREAGQREARGTHCGRSPSAPPRPRQRSSCARHFATMSPTAQGARRRRGAVWDQPSAP